MRENFNRSNLKLSIELLIFLYARSHYVKADVLSEEFGLSNRSIRRLISDLRDVGYNIISSSGPYGGYKLERSNIILPISITDNHRQAWQSIENTIKGSDLANKDLTLELLSIIGIQSQLGSYLNTEIYSTKSLLTNVKANIEEVYKTLMFAINNKQRVEIKYKSLNKNDNKLIYKEFRPQQFQFFNHTMYIKGYYDNSSDSFRTLRLSRFKDIRIINKKYSFNENFDKDNEKSAFSEAVYKLYPVELKIEKGNHDLLDYEYGENQVITEYDDHYILNFDLAGDLLIKELVLSMGVYCEIIKPQFIRNSIINDLNKIHKKYLD